MASFHDRDGLIELISGLSDLENKKTAQLFEQLLMYFNMISGLFFQIVL